MKSSSKDFFRFKQFTIDQRHAAQKVGTDCDLLGNLASGGRRMLDIGTGTGVLSLMMAQRFPDATVTAIDIDEQAIIDATTNFQASPFGQRISLRHVSFQDFLLEAQTDGLQPFDAIICNPPYFDRSLESGDRSRTRARHTSALPFLVLIEGAYSLLAPSGTFSVCIPPEVYSDFTSQCIIAGFWPMTTWRIHALPDQPVKRYVLTYSKSRIASPEQHTACMRRADHSYSEWYRELTRDFLLDKKSLD